jgi:aryl-alcohol dehydrogenase-like predicted oxidoreductase
MRKLGVDELYGLLIHHAEQLLTPDGESIYLTLRQLKSEGKISRLGVSIYSPNDLDKLIPYFDFDIIQAPFSLFDQRLKVSGWLQKCQELGIEVHGRSIFLQGLLLMDHKTRPETFARWNHLWNLYDCWLRDTGTRPIDACLNFALSEQGLNGVVIGVDGAAQLQQLLDLSSSDKTFDFPSLSCNDLDLIHPSQWTKRD